MTSDFCIDTDKYTPLVPPDEESLHLRTSLDQHTLLLLPQAQWRVIPKAFRSDTDVYIDPDGRQYTKRTDRNTNKLQCTKRCKGQMQEIFLLVFATISEHTCLLPSEQPDIKLSVNVKAKEILTTDKTRRGEFCWLNSSIRNWTPTTWANRLRY